MGFFRGEGVEERRIIMAHKSTSIENGEERGMERDSHMQTSC